MVSLLVQYKSEIKKYYLKLQEFIKTVEYHPPQIFN